MTGALGEPYEGPLRFVELFGGPQDGQKQQVAPNITKISFPVHGTLGATQLGDVHHWYRRSSVTPEVFDYAGEGPV